MLTTLSTVKSRLGLDESDVKDDALLTTFIKLATARFENECNRVFGYSQNIVDEFQGDETELRVSRYPIDESQPITFGRLVRASEGWQTVADAEFVLRKSCVISLLNQLGGWKEQLRAQYSGGYLLPDQAPIGDHPLPPLPDDLQFAAVEQITYWYQNKDRVGLASVAAEGGKLQQFPGL